MNLTSLLSNISPTLLILSVIFSLLGMIYYSLGKTRGWHFKASGIALMLFPYVISNLWAVWIIGIILAVLPYALVRLGLL